jgi:aminopeptidase N
MLIAAAACGQPPRSPALMWTPAPDPSSFANVTAFVTRHLTLDLQADFDASRLRGTATLDLERRDPLASELVLDTRDLDIAGVDVSDGSREWTPAAWRLATGSPALGTPLHVTMPAGARRVRLSYASSPAARGLQWLAPAQTGGKRHPFLFSQAEAIQARSFIPLQDTPGVRLTYDATLRVPAGLTAVMAAESLPDPTAAAAGVFRFRMPQAVPSYLIALAAGDLRFRALGPRTGVWAEPSMVDAAAHEFADTERMLAAAEALFGPYRWGRYDLLVLPPSFPFGGMENPRLTFATPTVIVGDKSLVALVAHELAHSWSGNLTTNATWRDFWLNEGFTVYVERRILEFLYGRPRADMEAVIGLADLAQARQTLDVPGDRTLLPDLTGRDPDDAFSSVPYEQGALLLTFLESRVGRAALDPFIRSWFDRHAFQSVTTADFLAFLQTHLLAAHPGAVTDEEIETFLHSETVPPFAVLPKSDALTRVEAARDAWLARPPAEGLPALASAAAGWSTHEWVHFLESLPDTTGTDRLAALDRQFHLTDARNPEIAHVWFRRAIACRYEAAYPALERYLLAIGRRKLIVPLYRDLAATPSGLAFANRVYAAAREGYHPMARYSIEALLDKNNR